MKIALPLSRPAVLAALLALAGCQDDILPANVPDDTSDVGTTEDVSQDPRNDAPDVASDTSADADVATDSGDADSDVHEDVAVDAQPDLPQIVSYAFIDTQVVFHEVQAGDPIAASCILMNEAGEVQPPPVDFTPVINFSPTDAAEQQDGQLIAVRAGGVRVWCASADLGLTDNSAEEVTISPGPVAVTTATVYPHVVTADTPVEVTCEGRDAFDNLVPDTAYGVAVAPSDGTTLFGTEISATIAGLYEARCTHPDTIEAFTETFEVLPSAPANLRLAIVPERPLYGLGDVISVEWEATDAHGNIIADADVALSSTPELPTFGLGRFRLSEEGTLSFTGTLPRFEDDDAPLTDTITVLVNEDGPEIVCTVPFNGEILNRSPEGTLLFGGTVSDGIGVQEVFVNDEPAVLEDDGFSYDLPIRYGINFVNVEAVDTLGERNSQMCSFLVADRFAPTNDFLDDTVTLRLAQDAFDDGDPAGAVDSLNDLLVTAIRSSALRDMIHSSFANDPVLYDDCVLDSFVGCVIDAKVKYQDSRVGGRNDMSLTLVNNGIRAVVTIRNAAVKLDIDTAVDSDGWVTLRHVTLDFTIRLGVSGGIPTVTGVTLNGSPSVGSIDTDFDGLSGDVLGALADLFEDDIRDAIRDAIKDFMTESIADVVGGVFEGLDISSFADDVEVDRLDDSGTISLGFGLRFSTLTTNSTRALFGIGTRVTGPPGRPAGEGAPVAPDAVRRDPDTPRTIAAAVSYGLFEQAVFALWRAEFFDVTLDEDAVDALPEGSLVTLDVDLPPVITGTDDGRIAIMLGGVSANVLVPSLLAEPLSVGIGAVVSASADIVDGDTLTFGDFVLDEFYLATPNASLSADTRSVLEGYLRSVLQTLADDALSSALPTLPIPSFDLPDDLGEFGIPAGLTLGLSDPAVSIDESHFIAEGNFGAP